MWGGNLFDAYDILAVTMLILIHSMVPVNLSMWIELEGSNSLEVRSTTKCQNNHIWYDPSHIY